MPQDLLSSSEHQLILKNVESLRAAVDVKANGEVSTEKLLPLESFSQKWKDFESRNVELLCRFDIFEKAFEAQQSMASASTTAELEKLLEENKNLESVFASHKVQLDDLHSLGDELIQISQQDSQNVKKLLEAADQRWNQVLCSLKSRVKFLESKLSAFRGFDVSLRDFHVFLSRAEAALLTEEAMTPTTSEGTESRKALKKIRCEMDEYDKILDSLNSTGTQLTNGLQATAEAKEDDVQTQLRDINQRWNQLTDKCKTLQRLELKQYHETQSKAFSILLEKLTEVDVWLKLMEDELSSLANSPDNGASAAALESQADHCQNLQQQFNAKSLQVENYLHLGKQSLARASKQPETRPEDLRLLAETVAEHLMKTESKWIAIREKMQLHCSAVTMTTQHLASAESRLVVLRRLLDDLETVRLRWAPVGEIPAMNLQSSVDQARLFEVELMPVKIGINECAATVELFRNQSTNPSLKYLEEQLEDIRERMQILEVAAEERLNLLMITALKKIEPANQHQLSVSVTSPWKRAVTDDKQVPYYINDETESTEWNHPEMLEIQKSLADLNDIKFSAYRTAMKLQLLRKRLSLERLRLSHLLDLFGQSDFAGPSDRAMTVDDVIRCLTSLFAGLKVNDSELNSVLCVDLTLNWLLNVYDSLRTGQIWPMSLKMALLLMSSGSLEDKCRALFGLVADGSGCVDEFRLSLLVQDCIQIPKQLGESASFSGSSVNAAVHSCFEKSDGRLLIGVKEFSAWMKLDPQPLVWISVMQRLTDAETLTHQAKCSVCRMSPIVGLRYRCLRCFSLDLCQNCFFLGRSVKDHESTHPMQEYTRASSSGEDVKSISKVLRNKFRSPEYYKKHPRLGYLPIKSNHQKQTEAESISQPPPPPPAPMTSVSTTTTEMHSRLELYASRLAELEKRSEIQLECDDEHKIIGRLCEALGGGSGHRFQLQSPMQIVMALDADQKSQLDVIMKDLEEENRELQAQYDLLKVENRNMNSRMNDEETPSSSSTVGRNSDHGMIAEANLLRSYKERLENRMEILEDHNNRLNSQLHRLRQLLSEGAGGGGGGVKDDISESTVVCRLRQSTSAPGTPSLSSSHNSLPQQRRWPLNYSSSSVGRRNNQLTKDKELISCSQKTNNNNNNRLGFHIQLSQDSLENESIGIEENRSLSDVAIVGKELDRLIDGIISYVDPSSLKDESAL